MGQILNILGRLALNLVQWLETALPVALPAFAATYLYGRHWGFKGAALRLYVCTGVFLSVIATPVVIVLCGLDSSLWTNCVSATGGVFCYKVVKWTECYITNKLGIDRRKSGEDEESSQKRKDS